jgi:hypothetical protein
MRERSFEMISEQTAIHSATSAFPAHQFDHTYGVVDVDAARSEERRKCRPVFAPRVKAAAIALLGTVASWGNPRFFERERRDPTFQRLGPGLGRESDSFWPLSQW